MKIEYDEDEYETIMTSRPCTVCHGDTRKCNGGCNGMSSWSHRRRDPAEVRQIKADRERNREDTILAEAAAIRARRNLPPE